MDVDWGRVRCSHQRVLYLKVDLYKNSGPVWQASLLLFLIYLSSQPTCA
jgi:hypothetical protein